MSGSSISGSDAPPTYARRVSEPPIHPLENPIVWLGIQLVELVIVITLFKWLVPSRWSAGSIAIPILGIVGLVTWGNYVVRRRFIPR